MGSRIKAVGDWTSIKIAEIIANAKRARIYDNKHVTWGRVEFELSNSQDGREEDLTLFYVVESTFVDFRKFEMDPPPGKQETYYATEVANPKETIADYKNLKLAFFIEGSEMAKRINDLNEVLIRDVSYQAMIVTLLATTLLIILGVMRVKRLSQKMTAQIIYLYETLYQISNDSKRKGAVELSYKDSSKELNELHLTFNRVARTMALATQSMAV